MICIGIEDDHKTGSLIKPFMTSNADQSITPKSILDQSPRKRTP
jgi:hypothetical protein